MAKVDSWMPIYWGDYAKDTGHLGAVHHGAYLMLLKHYWVTAEPLPADDAQLWRIACTDSLAHWRKIKPVVLDFFTAKDGRLHHGRVEAELAKAVDNADRRADLAKRAAEARWGKPKRDARSNARSNASRMPGAMPGECPPPSPKVVTNTPSLAGNARASDWEPDAGAPETPKTAAVSRSQPIPFDWQPSEETRRKLAKSRPDLTPETVALRMVEFHSWAKAGAKTTFDPDATWLGFMVKTHVERTRENQRSADSSAPTVADGVAAAFARRFVQP